VSYHQSNQGSAETEKKYYFMQIHKCLRCCYCST